MTLDEAIKHCEEAMMENLEKTKDRNASDPIAISCGECASEHHQLAEWLKELKAYREQTKEAAKMSNNELRFFLSQYLDGYLEIECKHMHYAFDDRFNFDHFPKKELFQIMSEIQEHCEAEGLQAKFVFL